jgi:hypothetical protein
MLRRIARTTARALLTLGAVTLLIASAGGGRGLGSSAIDHAIGAPRVDPASAAPGISGSIAISAAVLPGSRAVRAGTTAQVFATIVAGGAGTATNCAIALPGRAPVSFAYQAIDLGTTSRSRLPNTPTDIAAGSLQSFVISLTPTAPFTSELVLAFDCDNTPPAPVIPGVNTLLLTSAAGPTPDIVAVGATPTRDGIVTMFGSVGTGLFAVAASNVGERGVITASADTGGAGVPVDLLVCQTDPSTGACLGSPARSVQVAMSSHATATFTAFIQAVRTIPFDPATSRVFVRFRTLDGTTVGSTSAALQTL